MRSMSVLAAVGGLIALTAFALGAVLMIAPGPESTQRLALFFGLVGTGAAALVALLRADQAQSQTNGALDDRIEAAVYRAQAVRRREIAEQRVLSSPALDHPASTHLDPTGPDPDPLTVPES